MPVTTEDGTSHTWSQTVIEPGDAEGARAALYEVTRGDRPTKETVEAALSIGREYLDVENGHVERVDGDEHEIVASVGGDNLGLGEGTVLDRATTFCRRTVEMDTPLAVTEASEQGWRDDPAHLEQGLECYLGASVFVRGDIYGTVCFVSREARASEFTAVERAFVELVARTIGRVIETDRREQALAASERKYESLVTTSPDAIVLIDRVTEAIEDVNDAAMDIVDADRSWLIGRDVRDLLPPGENERYLDELDRVADEETTVERFEDGQPILLRRADESTVPVEVSARTLELDGREFVQCIVRDVSDRRARERELQVKDRAMDEAPVGITIADATVEDEPLVYANAEFGRLTGYEAEDVLGYNCRFLQGPDTDPETVDRIRDAIDAGEPIQTEILNYRASGTPF
ncbi:MAG: PAS domain-containing protein [Haloarculaceae archaeon]